jgi:hypothetical protein
MTKKERKEYNKEYYKKNKNKDTDIKLETSREWKRKNKDKVATQSKKYRESYKKRRNRLERKRRKADFLYRLINNSRRRVNFLLRSKSLSKNKSTEHIIGCSYSEYKKHLEKGFIEGMTWDNYGEWHIDHIIPLASARNEGEIYELLNYKNTQPLWAIDNLIKGDRMPKQLNK